MHACRPCKVPSCEEQSCEMHGMYARLCSYHKTRLILARERAVAEMLGYDCLGRPVREPGPEPSWDGEAHWMVFPIGAMLHAFLGEDVTSLCGRGHSSKSNPAPPYDADYYERCWKCCDLLGVPRGKGYPARIHC